jgi:hypothetical protein
VPRLVIAYQRIVDYNGYKYRYVVTPTHTSVNWIDFYRAEQECVKWGGHLTSIHSQQELNFVKVNLYIIYIPITSSRAHVHIVGILNNLWYSCECSPSSPNERPLLIPSFSFFKGLATRSALTYVGHDINKWTDGTRNDFTSWKTQLAPRLTFKRTSSNLKQPAFICKRKCKFKSTLLPFLLLLPLI